MNILAVLFFLFAPATHAGAASYKTSGSSCAECVQLDRLLAGHNTELSPDERLKLTLEIANVIKKISLKGKKALDQKRAVYFAINASVQVLDDDFDSASIVRLMDLRGQAPKQFDYVFWRFPLGEQQRIVERMRAAKTDIRPNARIPSVKALE